MKKIQAEITSKIIEINDKIDYPMRAYILESGHKFIDSKDIQRYEIGQTVKCLPFMGAIKVIVLE